MAFDAQQKKVNDVLSGDVKYVIPRYQRKYVWQEKQWRELFDDIKYCLDVSNEYKEKGQEIECGDFLGGRKVNASQEDALNSMKNAVYMYLFASIMKKDKGYKTMAFTITACNSAIYDNSMKTEVVCKVGYKEMIQLIKDGYRSPLFDTRKLKSLVDMRLKELKIA